MTERLRKAVAPAYLFLCLLLGGSPQGVWTNAVLQLLAVAIITWGLIELAEESLPRPVRQLLAMAAAAVLMLVVQLIPLPVSFWTALPGREFVADGFQLLGIALPAMPISLAPYDSIAMLPSLLPPLAIMASMVGLRAYSAGWLAAALIGGAVGGVLLGILQVSSAIPSASPWYLYPITNFGVATGFFANSNHMATLLLVTIPFIAASGAALRQETSDMRARTAGMAVAVGALALAVLGLALNRSLAGYGLGVPVLLASLMILFGMSASWVRGAIAAIGLTAVAALALAWISPIGAQMDRLGAATSIASRQEIVSKTFDLTARFAPLGSGIGTFPKLYVLTEDPDKIDRVYVNHAHNDYLELALETGVPGVLIIVLFLLWWGKSVVQMLRCPAADHFAMAGAIASAAVLLHSLVDYPMRTAAISSVFAMAIVMVIQSRRTVKSDTDIRPARHLILD